MGIIMTTKELRPRQKNDFYPTPIELCRAALDTYRPNSIWEPKVILDPGCGTGVWGKAARERWPHTELIGVEIEYPHKMEETYTRLYISDFRKVDLSNSCDLVIGNPPYSLAEEFIRKGWECLKTDGTMIYLLRLAFLEGQKRSKGLWKQLPPSKVYVLGRRPSFTGNGKTDATAYCLMRWDKPQYFDTELSWLNWDYDHEDS